MEAMALHFYSCFIVLGVEFEKIPNILMPC